MRKKYIRHSSLAARFAVNFGFFSVCIFVLSLILHRLTLLSTKDFLLILAFVGFFSFITLILALKGFYDLWRYGDLGGLKSLKAMIYFLLIFLPFTYFAVLWVTLPAVHDISTDVFTPPSFIANERPSDAILLKSSLTEQLDMQAQQLIYIAGRRYDGSPDRIMKSIIAVLAEQGWPVIARFETHDDGAQYYIQTKAKTFYLGFISDIVIRLSEEGDMTYVDMRSASRYLTRDLGANSMFITSFMHALDVEMISTPTDQEAE